jgi:translation elongation factor EF-4
LANVYLALESDLAIIPVLNKIDLPAADVDKVSAEIISLLGCKREDILHISAKTGQGVDAVLERIVSEVPAPQRPVTDVTRALIFDSYYDDYRGVILYVRVFDGAISKSEPIKMMATNANGIALEVGALKPDMAPGQQLGAGEIGYIVTNLKTTRDAKVGDTVTLAKQPSTDPLPGYKDVKPFVYAGFFPEIVVPQDYVGAVIQLISAKRGIHKNLSYVDQRALVSFEAPLANLLTDFYDQLKSVTSGYGSFNYELADYRAEDLVRVDFYVAGEMVSSLSIMVHRSESMALGREVVGKLKEVIPRQNFQVALQAAIGGRFIAREDLSAYRKDVTTGLYGGDVSRKKKVLAKQALW